MEGALSWIEHHLAHFDPYKDGRLSGLCEIPLAELAILVLSALRCSERVRDETIRRCLDLLQFTYHRSVYRERPFREPETLVPHVMVAAALERAGRLSPDAYRGRVERLVRASTLTAPSLPPHRLMELRHALDLAGVAHTLPSYSRLFRSTLAAQDVNPIFLSKAEAYIVTHVIFYAADLGHRPPVGVDERDAERLRTLVERLLGMYLVAGNWDLTAELVLCARCLRRPCAFVDFAWQCIADAQRTDGAVPGTRAHPQRDQDPERLDDAESDVSRCYHTTLVTALAAFACIHDSSTSGTP